MKYQITKPVCAIPAVSTEASRYVRISLPPAPFAIPHDDRRDTAPRSALIRAGKGIPTQDRMLRWIDRKEAGQ